MTSLSPKMAFPIFFNYGIRDLDWACQYSLVVVSGAGCMDSLGLDNKLAMCGEISRELDYVTDTNTALITFKIGREPQAHY